MSDIPLLSPDTMYLLSRENLIYTKSEDTTKSCPRRNCCISKKLTTLIFPPTAKKWERKGYHVICVIFLHFLGFTVTHSLNYIVAWMLTQELQQIFYWTRVWSIIASLESQSCLASQLGNDLGNEYISRSAIIIEIWTTSHMVTPNCCISSPDYGRILRGCWGDGQLASFLKTCNKFYYSLWVKSVPISFLDL